MNREQSSPDERGSVPSTIYYPNGTRDEMIEIEADGKVACPAYEEKREQSDRKLESSEAVGECEILQKETRNRTQGVHS